MNGRGCLFEGERRADFRAKVQGILYGVRRAIWDEWGRRVSVIHSGDHTE